MDKFYLLKFQQDYADEFDVYGFKIYNEEDYNKYLELTKENYLKREETNHRKQKVVTISFGTNEEVEFYSLENYLKSFDLVEITEDEFNILNKLFDGSFGFDYFFPLEY